MKPFAIAGDAKKWLGAVSSGALLTVSFPGAGLWLAGWIALCPLFAALKGVSAGKGFRLGFAAGLVHFLTLLYWLVYTMRNYGGLPIYLAFPVLFLLAAYMALYTGVFGALATRWVGSPWKLLFAAPALWVGLEYVRGVLFSGFPWSFLGYCQAERLLIVQISDIFGVYGVTFLMVMGNAAMFSAAARVFGAEEGKEDKSGRAAVQSIAVFVLFLAATLVYGQWRLSFFEKKIAGARSKTITAVQGNIDQAIKWAPEFQESTTRKYLALSKSALDREPDLVVWPETAVPFYFLLDPGLTGIVLEGVRQTGTDFIIGSPSLKKGPTSLEYYNSAYLVEPTPAVTGKYDKVHLVPFGEYVPFKKWLPFLGKMVAQVGDFKSGEKGGVLNWKNERVGMQICFEIIFPDLSRAMVENGADFLVNITNDAWFAKTSAPRQHFNMAVFRAVENRRALVRAANTGISGFVEPTGKVPARSGLFEEAVLTRDIPLIENTTVYTRVGDLFAHVCAAASLTLILFAAFAKKRGQKRG